MEPRHFLRCLGQPALFTPSGELIRIRTKKHLALLVYLAIESRRSHRRDRLAELLWPKAKVAEARHSLATALSFFRSRLGSETLEASREHAAIRRGRLALDLDRLLAGDILGDERTPALEVGAFLDGFDIPDATDFTLWKDHQQARLLPAIKQALVVLIDRCRRTGDFRQIEELADQMLTLDDLSEEAIRAKMEARALAGDRITALRVYEDWKAKLADDLQAAPSEFLEGMAVRLRGRGWERALAPTVLTVPTEHWRDRPFVGRATEYRVLYKAWEKIRNGLPGHVLLLGDSGVGKTTLVQRLMTAVALEGAAVARVQCYDVEREIPYSALSTLIVGLLDQPDASATQPEALAELSRSVPEVRRRFPSIPPSTDSHGETARIRLTEAFLELLFAIGEEHPILLVVDDFHFADDASLAVLHLVIRRTRGRPIMVLSITRPGDLPQSPQTIRLRENAAALGIHEIEVAPLTGDESQTLLTRLVPADQPQPDTSTRRAMLRAAAGYPMVLELLVQDWQGNGDRCLALSVDAMTTDLMSDGTTTATYSKILQCLTWTLSPSAQNVLSLAAVLGHRLNDLDMYTLTGLGAGETLSGIAELVNRRVLRDGGQKLEFANELIRSAAYLGVPSSIRKRLHSQIADRFLHQERTVGMDLGLEVAWHCTRAGRQDEAIEPLMRGARNAIRRGASHMAERALMTALPILRDPERSRAILLLTETLQEQSRWQDSLNALQQLTSYATVSVDELAYVLRLTAERRLGSYDGVDRLTEFVNDLVRFIHSSHDISGRLKAAVEAAATLNIIRCRSLATKVLEVVSSMSGLDIEEDERPRLFLARAMVLFNLGDYIASVDDITAALETLNKRQAINSTLAMLQAGLGSIQSLLGEYAKSVDQLTAAVNTATRIGNERIYLLAAGNLSIAYCRLGQYKESVKWAETTSSYAHELYSAALQGMLLSNAMLGDSKAVDTIIERWTWVLRCKFPPGVWQAWGLLSADAYLMLGRLGDAEECARRAILIDFDRLVLDYCAGAYARWIARLGERDHRSTAALQELQRLHAELSRYHRMDQVEILVAIAWLEHRMTGKAHEKYLADIQRRLDNLPGGITEQLVRTGMLDWM